MKLKKNNCNNQTTTCYAYARGLKIQSKHYDTIWQNVLTQNDIFNQLHPVV